MAAKLNLLSLSELQQLGQSSEHMSTNQQGGPGSEAPDGQWVWNPKVAGPSEALDDSWEVRAFAEDYTGSAWGSTWPPRFYTCTFCKREFRSAQALGGHMNVHRRDRASKRFNNPLPSPSPARAMANSAPTSTSSTSDSALVIPARDLAKLNGGFCLLYQLPPQTNSAMPGNRFSTSPTDNNNILAKPGTREFASSHQSYSSKIEASSSDEFNNSRSINCANSSNWNRNFVEEDLDLELRLGQNPSA